MQTSRSIQEKRNPNNKPGYFFTFEGIDGVGKTTTLKHVASSLREKNYPVVETYEPTHEEYGQRIRDSFEGERLQPADEARLFVLDRHQHVVNVIVPALKRGEIILCDRYWLSTCAYQGARGLDIEKLIWENSGCPDPDISFLFDLDPEEAHKRLLSSGRNPNMFEDIKYQEKVCALFRGLSTRFRWIVDINATEELRAITDQCLTHILKILDR